MLVNCEINVNNPSQYITEERLLELTEGLVCVFPPASYPYDQDRVEMYMDYFKDGCYFQLDSVEYTNDESDKDFLLNTLAYMKDGRIQPILITDAYYLDADDHIIKPILNSLLKVREKASVNQFFKDDLTIMEELDPLIKGEKAEDMLVMAIANLEEVAERCNYQIPTGVFHLPRYQMNPDEAELYETPEDLFYALIQEGLEKKVIDKGKEVDQYMDRLDTEMKVIQKGGFIDYFLILWDVANFCKKNDILVGLGRGCFLPDSMVLMSDGTQVPIQEVEVGRKVKNYFEGESLVTDIFRYEIEEEIVELEFENGKKISCTKDHKIYTSNKGWVEADELTEDDNIIFVN